MTCVCTSGPGAEQIDQEVASEAGGEHLRDDVEVGHQGRLQDDGDVGGVEELDGVGVGVATVASRLDGQVHSEALTAQKEWMATFEANWIRDSDEGTFILARLSLARLGTVVFTLVW